MQMYTDPGAGLFVLQIAVAACLTAGYRFRRTLAIWFKRLAK